MSEELEDLKIKIEFMENNISEINLYLEEAKQSKTRKIPHKVFDLHKETTNCAKEVSEQLKQLAVGSDLKEMRTHRMLLIDFLTALSDLSSLQRLIIDKSVHNNDCVDCGPNFDAQGTKVETYLWIFAGIAVIGGIYLFRSLK